MFKCSGKMKQIKLGNLHDFIGKSLTHLPKKS